MRPEPRGFDTTERQLSPRLRGERHSTMKESKIDAAGAGARVLVCDDESRLALLTAGLLGQYGHAAFTVGSGEEALARLESHAAECDVLLLDLNLPERGAEDVLLCMRDKGFRQPIILTSGYAEEDVAPELLADPQVAGYLPKPYSVDQLVGAIRRAVTGAPRSATFVR